MGPLPGLGITVLEASAGTGKTYTVAAMVARMLAEGACTAEKLLVVTFTRAATSELRERARQRLLATHRDLQCHVSTGWLPDEPLARFLVERVDRTDGVRARRDRLARALAEFDRATITTTHGFCHMVLAALGVWGEVAPGASILEAPEDLVREVSDDLYARWVVRNGPLPFRPSQALEIAKAAIANTGARIVPDVARPAMTELSLRSRLAAGVRKETDRRLLDANLLTYDALINRLANALEDAQRGPAAVQCLQQRFNAVLVDEFQDTDVDQWRVVKRAFGDGKARLVLIGDPKQAIYAFRGADVHAYLGAVLAAGPDRRLTLSENWRADGALVLALDVLISPLHLGHPDIAYEMPSTPPGRSGSALSGADRLEPLRLRLVREDAPGLVGTRHKLVTKRSAQQWVARDLAADIYRLLGSGARISPGAAPGTDPERHVGPGDIGVLVRTNRQAVIVQEAMRQLEIPVVVAGAQSVLTTVSARHWLHLLSALEQPASRSLAVAVALSDFVGVNAADLVDAPDALWEGLHERLHEWAGIARAKGIATLFSHITAQVAMPSRLLGYQDGERRLTDLAHVSELLHARARRHQLGIAALRAWLARHVEDQVGEDVDTEQRARRLDTDADAVQVLTVHRAKGLEFPIVYCPFAWDGTAMERAGGPIVFHDLVAGGERSLDVGGSSDCAPYSDHFRAHQVERRAEELRHFYVAITRAKHQVVVWWAPVKDSQHSALGRVLFSKDAHGDVKASGLASPPRHDAVRRRLQLVAEQGAGLVSVEDASLALVPAELCNGSTEDQGGAPRPQLGRHGPAGADADDTGLIAASLARDFDRSWGRSSYSSILAMVRSGATSPTTSWPAFTTSWSLGGTVSSEPERVLLTDEPDRASSMGPPLEGPERSWLGSWQAEPAPLGVLPGGAEVGTLVHSVLEAVDFSARPLTGALGDALARCRVVYTGPPLDGPALVEGLSNAIGSGLGGPLGSFALADLKRRDRVDEMRFEMPLAGGARPSGAVTAAALANSMRRHLPEEDPLHSYPDDLESLGTTDLRGYLTGSLDLVFRTASREGTLQYFVADYKTNKLAAGDEPLVFGHYGPDELALVMRHSHYPLQALFYLVALHRYLSWRLAGYEPGHHLGGAAYLFLRGMRPPSEDGAPLGHGVFWWCPPAALVEDVSRLLASPAPANPGRAPRYTAAGRPRC